MACRNGSQTFFWLTEASVEMMPKLSSVGACAFCACALAARPDTVSATAVAVHARSVRNILVSLLSLEYAVRFVLVEIAPVEMSAPFKRQWPSPPAAAAAPDDASRQPRPRPRRHAAKRSADPAMAGTGRCSRHH